MNGFSVKDEKLARKKAQGDGEEILPAVSVRCPFPLTLPEKANIDNLTLVLELGKVSTSFGLGWKIWGMSLGEVF